MNVYIKTGKKTAEHAANLEKLGYTVTQEDGHLAVECTGTLSEFTVTAENLAGLIRQKQMLTYKTEITFPDGKVCTSIPACGKLGKWSCLVAKTSINGGNGGFDFDEVMGLI
jgi:hypothetical protein